MPTGVMTLPSLEPHSYRGTQQHPGAVGEEKSETPEDTPAQSSTLLGAQVDSAPFLTVKTRSREKVWEDEKAGC